MEPISGVGSKGGVKLAKTFDSSIDQKFSNDLKLAKAKSLLRQTGPYEKWQQLRQRSDDPVLKTSDILSNPLVADLEPVPDFEKIESTKPKPPVTTSALIIESIKNNTASIVSDDNLLVISAEYQKFILNDGFIGYGDSKKLLLPLSDISRILDFSIDVDAGKGIASGWFVSENREFHLDVTKGEVAIDGISFDLPPNRVEVAESEIYVDAEILSKWFPVNFNFDFSSQSVSIEPREKLPFQARIERERAWKNIGSAKMSEVKFPRENSDYKLFDVPVVDLGITNSYINGTETNEGLRSDFNILAKGDLGKMTSEVYISGDDKEGLKDTRLTLRRDDPDGQLLGPLKATSLAVGDVRTVDMPIIGGGETEKGFNISNKDLNRSREFDTTFFEGNLAPGWDVEVYRNKVLIDSQRVGAEGKYSFNEIPVYYGKNDFKLIFYGPQGQERVETKSINVGSDLLKKGKSEYDLSVSQKNTSVYDPDETSKYPDEESLKLNATYNYGLLKNLSIGAGVSSQEVYDEHHDYLNLGLKGNFQGFYLSGDVVKDTEGGEAVELFTQTGIGDIDLRLKKRFYNNFTDDSGIGLSDPIKSETDISVSGKISKNPILPDMPFTLTYKETRKEDSTDRTIGSRLSGNLDKMRLNNYLQWEDTSSLAGSSSIVDGNLQAYTQVGNFRVRGQLDYELDPEIEITSAGISNFYTISDSLSSELSLEKDLDEKGDFSGSFKLNWNNGKYILSPQVSYDSDGVYSAYLSFSTSLGMEPRSKKIHASSMKMADKGGISARVFNDKNNNKIFDHGDELIKGASVKALQSYQEAKTDETGVAFLNNLRKNKPTDIVLDKATLEDPFWEPSTPSHSVVPRPGHVQMMEIPVITTGEVDGTVFTKNRDGKEKLLPNVVVQLLNEKGEVVQEVRSEYDGFYYFQKVLPGKYSVRIDPDNTEKTGSMADLIKVEIDTDGTIASGKDIFLAKEFLEFISDAADDEQPARLAEGDKGLLEDSTGILAKREGTDMSGSKLATMPDKQDILDNIKEREQLQKDFRKLKAAYDKIIESEGEYEQTYVSKAAPIAKTSETRKTKEFAGTPRYGLHLTSYRTPGKAASGIKYLMNKYKGILSESDFTIKKVNVSEEKGIWYRVIAGSFANHEVAANLAKKIKLLSPYCKLTSLNDGSEDKIQTGVHLTSFRTQKKALLSIENLKRQYPSLLRDIEFTIKDVDLGSKMGKWKRVIAGRFENTSNSKNLAKRIKMQLPYCKTVEIEKDNEFGLHLASYRTSGKASEGIGQLLKKYGSFIENENLSIRKTDLGENKGVWYRILAGNFKNRESASTLKSTLNSMKQYAELLNF